VSNKDYWKQERVVDVYARYNILQEAEKVLFELLKPHLPQMRMLDLGVGAGRTTAYFCDLVREYVGVDYSEEMIRRCRQRFPGVDRKGGFVVGDVRQMSTIVKDRYYDFVLFSYNGIDYMANEDRIRALGEIRRVGNPGGYFVFSAHNLNCNVFENFRVKFALNPIRMAYRLGRSAVLRTLNWNLRWKQLMLPYSVIRDGSDGILLETYYIRPTEQIRQLTELGFGSVRIFSGSTGMELTEENATLDGVDDSWLYYLCRF